MPAPVLTVCGVAELADHSGRGVSHVVTLLDPGSPEPAGLAGFPEHRRHIFHFHDILVAEPGKPGPTPEIVAELLELGRNVKRAHGHLLVHCHAGVSRSTATMLMLMAQAAPMQDADELFSRLVQIRPQAWPNSVMVGFADQQLKRNGALTMALRRHYGRQLQARPEFHEWMISLDRKAELDMAL